jgi:hypothetical protein
MLHTCWLSGLWSGDDGIVGNVGKKCGVTELFDTCWPSGLLGIGTTVGTVGTDPTDGIGQFERWAQIIQLGSWNRWRKAEREGKVETNVAPLDGKMFQ